MLISNAYAQTAGAATQGFTLQAIILPLALLAVFYVLLIRPQQKRQKELRTLVDAVKSGDEVVTSGGMLGRVTRVTDQYLTLEVAQAGNSAVELMVQKSAVQSVLPKGTLKAI